MTIQAVRIFSWEELEKHRRELRELYLKAEQEAETKIKKVIDADIIVHYWTTTPHGMKLTSFDQDQPDRAG